MKSCMYCGESFDSRRPRPYCMSAACVAQGRYEHDIPIAIHLAPKQGFVPVIGKPESGRSSGR